MSHKAFIKEEVSWRVRLLWDAPSYYSESHDFDTLHEAQEYIKNSPSIYSDSCPNTATLDKITSKNILTKIF